MEVNTKFLLLYLSLDISTFKAVGRPSCAILFKSKKVGKIMEYIPIPIVPINLVNTILIIKPSILVINPPTINIIVDLINLFFILKFYS